MANSKATNNRGTGYGLDEKGDVVLKALSLRLTASNLSGTTELSLASLGGTLPAKSIVTEVYVNVITAEATATTKTLDVGTLSSSSGDADGFLDGVSVAATGLVKGTLASAGQTLGALLRVDESGAGVLVPEPYINTASKPISVTAGSSGFAELVADIIVIYKEITD